MPAGSYNIIVEQGATFKKIITYTNIDGTPINLTDVAEVRAQMRPTISSETFKDFTCSVYGTPTNGQILWTMPPSVTETLTNGTWVYDLEVEFNNGEVRRLLQGNANVSLEVTRE